MFQKTMLHSKQKILIIVLNLNLWLELPWWFT